MSLMEHTLLLFLLFSTAREKSGHISKLADLVRVIKQDITLPMLLIRTRSGKYNVILCGARLPANTQLLREVISMGPPTRRSVVDIIVFVLVVVVEL